jgi:acetaldehyde dehydrogenase/alcohol dehydrogenase
MITNNCQKKVDELLMKASEAAAIFSQMSQEQVDKIVKAVFEAGFKERIRLAKMAAEETGLGRWEDKVIKNTAGTLFVYEDIKNMKTAGIISDDRESGIMEIAQPLGPICAIIPVTNPTSTVMFKTLIALKTRNPIVISPHQKAIACCAEAARICYEAALKADAPEYCIQVTRSEPIDFKNFDIKEYYAETQALMSHPKLALILATGGSGVVKAAYTSGTPALGVGSGNVPVLIDETADIPFAVAQILMSKTFDYGTICASEQAIVVEKSIADKVISEFKKQKGYFLSESEVKAVETVAYDKERKMMGSKVVGQSVDKIASLAGIKVPADTRVLLAPLKGVGENYPLSSEILCPLLAFYVAENFEESLKICIDLNFFGGMGHSASIYVNNESRLRQFATAMNAGRILVNTPASQGAVGGIYNKLRTSLTLGCGTTGKNITTDNVSAKNLINIQRVARRRVNERFENFGKMERNGKSLLYDESLSTDELVRYFNLNY